MIQWCGRWKRGREGGVEKSDETCLVFRSAIDEGRRGSRSAPDSASRRVGSEEVIGDVVAAVAT